MNESELSGIVLMLILGLRHGLDPDHIAVIDGVAMQAQKNNHKYAAWVGTFFALGHGLVVTSIAVAMHFVHQLFTIPSGLFAILEWLPVFLLLLVGFLNLQSLLNYKNEFKTVSWRSKFVPKSIRNKVHPFSILLTGIIFALVFDTATQAAAWGYASSSKGGWFTALIMGLIFTIGMVFTDTLDGFLLNKIWSKTENKNILIKSRRILGWGIVSVSFLVAFYKITLAFIPAISLSDIVMTVIGLAFLLTIILFYTYTWFISLSNQPKTYGN
ncbi:MAG: hypothetical protein EAZ64_06430 [Sphingobacteriales bacterium]|nr:MAG: hypothetical protein EAZ64_06430 [Sphingobacteriales bacterium]